MRLPTVRPAGILLWLALCFCLAYPAHSTEDKADALPANLNHSLRQLVVWHRAQPRALSPPERRTRLAKSLPTRSGRVQLNADATNVVVNVVLDGKAPLADVRAGLTRLGLEVFAQHDTGGAGSVLSARLPLDAAESAARLPGVCSVSLVHRAWRRVGKATSQGVDALRTRMVKESLGFDGTGITVGVLSDSYDQGDDTRYYKYATHAADDVANGDLPGPANPFGHTQDVRVVDAFPGDDYQSDEGRAMLQIVHDLAPGARLVFQRVGTTPEEMADGILRLRSDASDVSCDVIVDDFGFPEEPMFSDGPAALAAKSVATSLLLPGHPAVYVSAAGNNGDVAYNADFAPVAYQDVQATGIGIGNLKLDQVPADLLQGGLHNFNVKPGKLTLSQKVKLNGPAEVSFQWDDAFFPGAITSDYNLLVFDAQGNYLADLSGTDDNLRLGKALEVVDLPLAEDEETVTYQFAISRRNVGTGEAKRLRYVINGGDPAIKLLGYNHGTTFGHNAGPNVIGVAAYAYDKLSHVESFSSLGPATVCFDAKGKRLAVPEVRQQPAVAAVDGVDTSFFPPGPLTLPDGTPATDSDGDGYPNFFGTSAAAPHVAAVAALLLQAAGGPGSLTPAQVLSLLQSTAAVHDLDANFVATTLSPGPASTVALSATADESTAASADKNVFHLTYDGPAGQYLSRVILGLKSTGLKFDTSDDGLPFTVGAKVGLSPSDVTAKLSADNTKLTLDFTPGAFVAGRALNFGIDRDLADKDTSGNSADLLDGASVKTVTRGAAGAGKAQGALEKRVGAGYSPQAGFGLINAQAAVKSLLANPPPAQTGLLPLLSGDLLLATSDNRLVETGRDGSVIGSLPVPNPAGPGLRDSYEHIQEAIVDGNGNVAVLDGVYHPYLTTINARTGAVSHLTAPGWDLSKTYGSSPLAGEIVASRHYVFATYGQTNPENSLGLLLRFDLDTGETRAFGVNTNLVPYQRYSSLAVGPDGMLYAQIYTGGLANQPIPVDVYDPETLALVRSVPLNFGDNAGPFFYYTANEIAVGSTGEIYALAGTPGPARLYKLDANGMRLATISLQPSGATGYTPMPVNLRVDPHGDVVVGSFVPLLVDPALQNITSLKVFADEHFDREPTVTATFVP